jgi:toxin ParE1/3/4
VVRTTQAEEDLIAIWTTIYFDNPAAADRVVDRLDETCRMLGAHPESGRARDDIAPGFRYFPASPYLVLYRIASDDQVEIVRIVHGRRDLASLF